MYLLLDLSLQNTINLSLFDEKTKNNKVSEGKNKDLLVALEQFLREQKINPQDIKGIMSVVGFGSFTSTRISATVANVFAYTLNIPIISITKEEAEDPQSCINKFYDCIPGNFISATYSGNPNIGPQKPRQ